MEVLLFKYLNNGEINTNLKGIRHLLNIPKEQEDELLKLLNRLELEGKIYCDERGTYTNFPNNCRITTLCINKNNIPFVEIKGIGKVNIKLKDLNGSLVGDKIIVEITSGKKPKAIVKKILERQNNIIVCEVLEMENAKKLVPFNTISDISLRIDHINMKHLVNGERVLVKLSNVKCEDTYEADFIESIGYKDDPDIDLKCVALSYGFKIDFSDEALEQVKTLPIEVKEEDLVGRVDLRDEMIYTIDGIHTKDMDDAISVKKLPNGHYVLGVHIAHVSHYIKPNTPLFEEANERTTSLYMIDSVIPMFPHEISNGICSLNPGVDRLTRTVELEFDEFGKVVNSKVYLSVINSKKKMSYEDINEMFKTNTVKPGYEAFIDNLYLARELNRILTIKREARGSVDFYSDELSFEMDVDGKISDIQLKHKNEAENIIENFMVLANEYVAKYSEWLKIPFIYRNHDMPDEKKLLEAIRFIKTLGFKVKSMDGIASPKVLQNIMKTLSDKEEFPILSSILLSSMCRAKYSPRNAGHYGLSLNEYTHFTSPIRRLPDLLVHTLLDTFENYNISKEEFKELEIRLQKTCDYASFKERQADAAEARADKLKMIEYVEENIDSKFDAIVIAINPSYVKIKTTNGIEGIVLVDDMLGDKYIFDKNTNTLKGKDSGYKYKIGLKTKVIAKRVSREELEIYFYIGTAKELKYTRK